MTYEILDIDALGRIGKLIKDEKLRKTTGKNASDSVKEYTWENTVNRLIKVFEKY